MHCVDDESNPSFLVNGSDSFFPIQLLFPFTWQRELLVMCFQLLISGETVQMSKSTREEMHKNRQSSGSSTSGSLKGSVAFSPFSTPLCT